ncbi:hypothetical protein [Pseudomonas kurunegalensis]|uniref:hypothetical protein n=1 Tax=Pseudomonas kurunegalensis TaxID=485880 RepID=UPI002117303C|nr:hypothetical protein [Pseudomonas kurunegalensis]
MTVLNLDLVSSDYPHAAAANLRLLMQNQAGFSQVIAATKPSQPITVEALPCL